MCQSVIFVFTRKYWFKGSVAELVYVPYLSFIPKFEIWNFKFEIFENELTNMNDWEDMMMVDLGTWTLAEACYNTANAQILVLFYDKLS